MTARVLFDSNVLVYAMDPAAPDKLRRAADTLDAFEPTGHGMLSTQVLGEFFRVVTQKLANPLTPAEAGKEVGRLVRAWPVLPVTALVVLEAVRGVGDHRLAYWDAQLWGTARLNQVEVILTEDFEHGRLLDGVRFLNPFVRSFDLATLLA